MHLLTQTTSYINNVTGDSTSEAPPEFRGGLLADDMGLGKTLTMICLIASNQANLDPLLSHLVPTPYELASTTTASTTTTLLIVSPACMLQTSEHENNCCRLTQGQ